MVSRRVSLAGLSLSTVLLALGYAGAFLGGPTPAWVVWCTAMGTALVLLSFIGLGAARDGIGVRLTPMLLLLAAVLMGGFAAMLHLPAPDPDHPVLWLGLPPGAAVLVYGVGLLPFFLAPVAYAFTFEAWTLREEDLERVRALAAGRADHAPGAADR